jgi:membrane protease YdiL (CAAX protease family)
MAEIGGTFIGYRLLDDLASRLPGVWMIACRIALAMVLIPAVSRWCGRSWRLRDIGIASPVSSVWIECIWLASLQAFLLLGALLVIARIRFYSILNFLVAARDRANCYNADYGPFVLAVWLFSLVYFAWGGELLCRGYIQGLGTTRFNGAAGGLISWLVFAAMPVSLALRLGRPLVPDALLWGLIALSPGPLCEAFYFRCRSILPLMAARAASNLCALAGIGFFLYWYPQRSLATALPLLWTCLLVLAVVTFGAWRRLVPLWRTALAMYRIGWLQGATVGFGLAAIVAVDGLVQSRLAKLGFCLAAVLAARPLSRVRASSGSNRRRDF